jgi:two-component system chemotaxis response regulator CheB
MTPPSYEIVAVGASWGGLAALRDLMAGLPAGFGTPIVIAQHRSADSRPGLFVSLLAEFSPLPVSEVEDKEPILPAHVYVAPPDYHVLVESSRTFALTTDIRVKYARPSIDELFMSACDAYGARVIAVVLTGGNDDGADGARCVAAQGGVVIVQEPDGAERPEMPAAALAAVPAATQLPLGAIADELVRLTIGVRA